MRYPAAWSVSRPNVIAVSATDPWDDFFVNSCYGPEVCVSAPGGYGPQRDGTVYRYNPSYMPGINIYSTTPNYPFNIQADPIFQGDPYTSDATQEYSYLRGTSMAAPHVTGVAALLLSVNSSLTPSQIRSILEQTSDDLWDSGYDELFGYGRINANRAVLCAKYNINTANIRVNPTLSGTISENTLVRGNITVSNNLTISNGKNFVVEDGSTVNIAPGKRITVNGAIIAKNVTFKNSATTRWYGIDVTQTGNNTSLLKKCTIYGGDYGVLIGGNTFILIEQCDIQGNNTGIQIYENGDPNIINCYIRGVVDADVASYGNALGKVTLSNLCGTAPAAHKNVASATTMFNYYGSGRNVLKSRTQGSTVLVTGGYPGYNNSVNIIERSYGASFNNQSGHELLARNNCWSPNLSIIGPVVIDPVNPSCPPNPVGPDWQLPKSSGDLLADAWRRYSDGEYAQAEELAGQAFDENKNGERAAEALFLHMKCAYLLGNTSEKQNKLQTIVSAKNVNVTASYEAVRWQMKHELKKKDKSRAQTLVSSIPDTSNMYCELLLDLAISFIEEMRDFEEAEKILSMYCAKSPGKEAEHTKDEILNFYKGLYEGRSSSSKDSAKAVVSNMPEENNLVVNYPNPFNPITTFLYSLTEPSNVELKIYDYLGREVAVLVNDFKEAGTYSVHFNAGSLASGVYFYKIQAGKNIAVKKLLFLK